MSGSTHWRTQSPIRPPLLQMPVTGSRIPRPAHLWPIGYRPWGFPQPPLSFNNLLEWSTEFRKWFTYNNSFILKDANLDQPNTEIHKVRSERVPDAELLYILSIEPECVNLLAGQHAWNRKCHPASVSRIFIGILFCRPSWLNHWHMIWTYCPLAPIPSLEMGRLGWYNLIQSPKFASPDWSFWCGLFSSWVISLGYLSRGPQGSPH